jgi:cell wall-associated NlpC family hydrolase
MATIEDVLLWAIAQQGDRYVFGAEVSPQVDDASAWDCSELVQWACAKADVVPAVPDGAYYQWNAIKMKGNLVPVTEGLRTRGALLFIGDGTGVGRDAITHVAFSLGDGTTIEARGQAWGVGSWASVDRFDFAGTIPGVDYGPGHHPLEPVPPAAIPSYPGLVALGSSGTAVRLVQQRLQDRGWSVTVDGLFGPATDQVVRSFQREKLLDVDGVVGRATWTALWQAPIT